jgi:hypothetical protein
MGVFPDFKLPIIPSHDLLCQLSLYDTDRQKWRIPDISRGSKETTSDIRSEAQGEKFSEFLNSVCDSIEAVTKQKPVRQWNSAFCNTVLDGSPILRKPDIILVDIDKRTPIAWPSVRAITEVTTQDHEPKRICNTVTNKTYTILSTQPDRVFVPILTVWGHYKFRFSHRPPRTAISGTPGVSAIHSYSCDS